MNLNDGLLGGHACRSLNSDIEVHFRNLEEVLLREVRQADILLGCVAWITSQPILEEIAKKPACLIVDRKLPRMNQKLQGLYKKVQVHPKDPIYEMLKSGHGWADYFCYSSKSGRPIPHTIYGDWNFEAGLYFVDGGSWRYMHHKFLLMLKYNGICSCGKSLYKPTVWTGSYNFTKNAKTGLENATIIRDPTVCASFLCEFLEVFHNHALQLNITGFQELSLGWKDSSNRGHLWNETCVHYEPLCRSQNYFPQQWFIPCFARDDL